MTYYPYVNHGPLGPIGQATWDLFEPVSKVMHVYRTDVFVTESFVRQGIQFLDREHPNWFWVIDLDTFNIRSHCDCVLGQLSCDIQNIDRDIPGTWDLAKRVCGLGEVAYDSENLAVQYGFNSYSDTHMRVLNVMWPEAIKQRLLRGLRHES